MALSSVNSFYSIINKTYDMQIPIINHFWISNLQTTSLSLNWSGVFHNISVFNGTVIINNVKRKFINSNIVNSNIIYNFYVTPYINDISGNTKNLSIKYIKATPVIYGNISTNTINQNSFTINNETGFFDYKNGNYIVTSSSTGIMSSISNSKRFPYYAFDNISNTFWLNDNLTYNSIINDNSYNTTLQNSSPNWSDGRRSLNGEWLQIKFPFSIQLYNYVINFYNIYYSTNFYIAGSNNGVDWDAIDYQLNNRNNINVSNIKNINKYSYFRFISRTNSIYNIVAINSWYINGIIYI